MAGSINRVTLLGRLGKDPEIRSFNSGGRVCNLSIATSHSWKDKNGEKKEVTHWHTVVVFVDGLIGLVEKQTYKRFVDAGYSPKYLGECPQRTEDEQHKNDTVQGFHCITF